MAAEEGEIGFVYAGWAQASLPHRRLADDAHWEIQTDRVSLIVQPGLPTDAAHLSDGMGKAAIRGGEGESGRVQSRTDHLWLAPSAGPQFRDASNSAAKRDGGPAGRADDAGNDMLARRGRESMRCDCTQAAKKSHRSAARHRRKDGSDAGAVPSRPSRHHDPRGAEQ